MTNKYKSPGRKDQGTPAHDMDPSENGHKNLGLPAPDVNDAVSFLERFRPGGPWVLTSIPPDRGTSTSTFRADRTDQLLRWLQVSLGHYNLYFQVNATGQKNITKKTTKADIVRAEYLHVDLDPVPGEPREPILQKLKDFYLPPHIIIDSGGGYQGFWRVSPCDDLSDVEAMNRWLAQKLGGDHCHNIDRIMRLPATINVPNKKKRSQGRVPVETRLMRFRNGTLDTTHVGRLRNDEKSRRRAEPVAAWRGATDILSLNEMLAPWAFRLLHDPVDANGRPFASRSHHMMAFVGACVRDGTPHELIAWCCLNPGFLVSGHALDQSDPKRAVERAIARAEQDDE